MPLKLDIKRKLSARSDRVKCVDLHPTEPWMLASLFNGNVHVWNFELHQLIKSFEVCDFPVRTAKFVARKNWVITGSDDMQLNIFNYNTLERVHSFDAHSDYIRSVVVHPVQPFVLSSSDDMLIKLWDWEKKWLCVQVFEGHCHYVMQIVINPKDNNTFATASLDKTAKVWNLSQPTANFTLEGHEKGLNCVDYYEGGEKPYLITGADDRLIKIWDYQTKTCVQTLEGHAQNISSVVFHPELPLVLSASEDGTVRIWHGNTYRLESTLNYGMERVWTIGCLKGSNAVALGYDEGSILIKLGREEPAMSMDNNGKVVFAKHAELQQTNIRSVSLQIIEELQDGQRLMLNVKDMGSCDIYPQTIRHNANGRFVVVCGDGEYIVYTAMALRNKNFGQAQEVVWAQNDASMYATREGTSMIKIYRNFKQHHSFKPDIGVDQIFGGVLLGVRCSLTGALNFCDWETSPESSRLLLIQSIEVKGTVRAVHWNEHGHLVALVCEDLTYILRYNEELVRDTSPENIAEDGIEGAFQLVDEGELHDAVKTATWVGDCFLYTNAANRLQYHVGGEIVTVVHLEREMYLLGYLSKENRVFLCDRDLNIVSYRILLPVLEYQTAVVREDFDTADSILPNIPRDQRVRVAHFLERRGFHQQALAVTTDNEHKFELALRLKKLQLAFQLAQQECNPSTWKQLAETSSRFCDFTMAQECLFQAGDYAALLLLCSSCGNVEMLQKVADKAVEAAQHNVAFTAYFLLHNLQQCLNILVLDGRLPEAAFFARTYCPSDVPRIVEMWRKSLSPKVSKENRSGMDDISDDFDEDDSGYNETTKNESIGMEKVSQSLANPLYYENLFPGYRESLKLEELQDTSEPPSFPPASSYSKFLSLNENGVLNGKSDECNDFVNVQKDSEEAFGKCCESGLKGSPISLRKGLDLDSSQTTQSSTPTARGGGSCVMVSGLDERVDVGEDDNELDDEQLDRVIAELNIGSDNGEWSSDGECDISS